MAGPRGYRQYRGRTSKAKVAAAIFLVLVILAAIVVMIFQRNLVYDETGTPHLELPWESGKPVEEPDSSVKEELDLTIEGPEEIPVEKAIVRAYAMPVGVLAADNWATVQSVMGMAVPAYDTVVVTLKDDTGKVYFDSGAAVSGAVKTAEDTAAVLAEIVSGDRNAVAKISCFHDPRAANSFLETMGLKNTGGYIFYDGKNSQWMDPSKEAARQYLYDLAKEAAELGFDEILLTDVGYPLEGKLDKIAYGEVDREATLKTFLQEMQQVLEPYSVALSVEIPEAVVAEGRSDAAGWSLTGVVPMVDRLYGAATAELAVQYGEKVAAVNDSVLYIPVVEASGPLAEGSSMVLG